MSRQNLHNNLRVWWIERTRNRSVLPRSGPNTWVDIARFRIAMYRWPISRNNWPMSTTDLPHSRKRNAQRTIDTCGEPGTRSELANQNRQNRSCIDSKESKAEPALLGLPSRAENQNQNCTLISSLIKLHRNTASCLCSDMQKLRGKNLALLRNRCCNLSSASELGTFCESHPHAEGTFTVT